MSKPPLTIQVDVERLKKLVRENKRLSIENRYLHERIAELEKEVRRLEDLWGNEPTDPGPHRK